MAFKVQVKLQDKMDSNLSQPSWKILKINMVAVS